MKKHAIQINTAKDRLNFALHMGANATMLGAAIVYSGYSNYVSYSGQADRIAAALLPSAVAEIGRRLYPYAKAALVGGGDLPEACLRPGERGRFYRRAARQISKRLGIADVPRIYIRSDGSYSRFIRAYAHATGKVVVSEALAKRLGRGEQRALLAHEMGHIKARHVFKREKVAAVGNVAWGVFACDFILKRVSMAHYSGGWILAQAGAWAVAASGAYLVGKSYSRVLEYQADRIAAQVTSPAVMADALTSMRKNRINQSGIRAVKRMEAWPWRSTHPTISKRVARLCAMPNP